MRGATQKCCYRKFGNDISIHAPRAGRDLVRYYGPDYDNLFQSTRPVRGATPAEVYCTFSYTISIHAPRAGRDPVPFGGGEVRPLFQSTRPVRGATLQN